MNTKSIDQEIQRLAQMTSQLIAYVESVAKEKYGRTHAEFAQYRVLESALLGKLQFIEQMAERGPNLPPRDGAVVLWVQRLGERIKVFHSAASAACSKFTWLKMLQQRSGITPKVKHGLNTIQEEQLIHVLARRQTLEQSKDYWQQQIRDLEILLGEQQAEYAEIRIAKENLQAGHSLQTRLGANVKDALTSPIGNSLNSLLRGRLLPLVFPKQFLAMQKALASYQAQADSYLQTCRSNALESMDPSGFNRGLTVKQDPRGPATHPPAISADKLQILLKNSQETFLERQKELVSLPFPESRPKLMQS